MPSRQRARAVVLAAEDAFGPIPKPFCRYPGSKTIVEQVIGRASRAVPEERISVVVTAGQRSWWEPLLAERRASALVVEPRTRGTATDLLLPLVRVYREDPEAPVLVLPGSHHVDDERVLDEALENALLSCRGDFQRVVVLGITPDEFDPNADWIVPAESDELLLPVEAFVDHPGPTAALRLMRRGALWNSLILAGTARALMRFYDRCLPALPWLFEEALSDEAPEAALDALFGVLGTSSFPDDVLRRSTDFIRVLPVAPCGFSDFRTPLRLERALERLRNAAPPPAPAVPSRHPLPWEGGLVSAGFRQTTSPSAASARR